MIFQYSNSQISFDKNSSKHISNYIHSGKKILFLSSRRGYDFLFKNQSLKPLDGQIVHEFIQSEYPTIENIQALYKKCNNTFDIVLAYGGGSVIDTAKVLIYMISNEEENLTDLLGKKTSKKISNKPFFVAIPTTAGTGSEVTQFATIWDLSLNKKYSLSNPSLKPDHAILDPVNISTMPNNIMLNTFMDALNQCFESFWSAHRTEKSERFSSRGIFHGLNLLDSYPDINYKKLSLMSLYSGLSISITKTGICHSISYPLTAHFGIPHGVACMFSFLELFKFNLSNDDGRFEKYKIHANMLERLERNFKKIDLYSKISSHASREDLINISDEIFHPDRINNNFCKLSKEEIMDIYNRSIESIYN